MCRSLTLEGMCSMMVHALRVSCLALFAGVLSESAAGQDARYSFRGTISSVNGPTGVFSAVQVADPFTVTVFIDEAAQGMGDMTSFQYPGAVLAADIEIGASASSVSLTPDPNAGIHVTNDEISVAGCTDVFDCIGFGSSEYFQFHCELIVVDNSGQSCPTFLTSTAGPFTNNVNNVDFGTFYIRATPAGPPPIIGTITEVIASSFRDLCSGNGGDPSGCTPCPCSNDSSPSTLGGCVNSSGGSSRLDAIGSPSLSLPPGSTSDLQFSMSHAPAGATAVLLSGNAIAPQYMANPCVGSDSGTQAMDRDGLRCVVQSLIRHGNRQTDVCGEVDATSGPSRVWGGPAQPNAGIAAQGGFAAGQTRYFQVTHRDDPLAVCMRGLNTSQAVQVTFTP